jgi:hypothetical protein
MGVINMTDPKPTLYLVTFTAEAPVLALDSEAACKLVQHRPDLLDGRVTVSAAPLDRLPDKWSPDAKVLGYREHQPTPTLSDAIAAGLAPNMRAWYLHEVDDGRMPTPDLFRAMWEQTGDVGLQQVKRVVYRHGDGREREVWVCEADRPAPSKGTQWVAFVDGVRVLDKYHEHLLLRGLVDVLAAKDVEESCDT